MRVNGPAIFCIAAAMCISAGVSAARAATDAVEFRTFSDQRTYPFQVRGMVVFPGVNWAKLPRRLEAVIVPALLRRPGVLSCVVQDQSVSPDGFDWAGMGSDAELQVCLFHAFASIGSAEGIAAWLGSLGFVQDPDPGVQNLGHVYNRLDESVRVYSFRWDTPGKGPFSGQRRGDVSAGRGFTYSTIEFVLDHHDRPLHVSINHHVPAVK